LQCKKMRDIALQSHKLYELYIEVNLQAFLIKYVKTLALLTHQSLYNKLSIGIL